LTSREVINEQVVRGLGVVTRQVIDGVPA